MLEKAKRMHRIVKAKLHAVATDENNRSASRSVRFFSAYNNRSFHRVGYQRDPKADLNTIFKRTFPLGHLDPIPFLY
jgi:hypothetical protein